jgi:hypothetical protein
MVDYTHDELANQILKKQQDLKKAKHEALLVLVDLIWSLVKMAGNLFLAFLGMCYQGYIISKIWLWFAVPFFKLPPLGLVEATGLLALWIMIKGVKYTEYKALKELEGKEKWSWFFTSVIFESTIFWFAYILKGHL